MQLLRSCYIAFVLAASLVLASCVGCNTRQNPDELRERTADATAAAKRDAKAVAQGIKEGLSRDKVVDVNTATREQLLTLPGISDQRAQRIEAGRPYSDSHDLVTRKILSEADFQKIKDRITAGK